MNAAVPVYMCGSRIALSLASLRVPMVRQANLASGRMKPLASSKLPRSRYSCGPWFSSV